MSLAAWRERKCEIWEGRFIRAHIKSPRAVWVFSSTVNLDWVHLHPHQVVSWSIFSSSTYRYSLFFQCSVSFNITPFFSLLFFSQSVCLYWVFYFIHFIFPLHCFLHKSPPNSSFSLLQGWQKLDSRIKKKHTVVFFSLFLFYSSRFKWF